MRRPRAGLLHRSGAAPGPDALVRGGARAGPGLARAVPGRRRPLGHRGDRRASTPTTSASRPSSRRWARWCRLPQPRGRRDLGGGDRAPPRARSPWARCSPPSILPGTPGSGPWPGKLFTPNRLTGERGVHGNPRRRADRRDHLIAARWSSARSLRPSLHLARGRRSARRAARGPSSGSGAGSGTAGANIGNPGGGARRRPGLLANLAPYFTGYIEARRAEPERGRHESAGARSATPTASCPSAEEVVRLASILLRRRPGDHRSPAQLRGCASSRQQPALADELRADPSGIPNFVEECLRLEGPIKSTFRLALEDTRRSVTSKSRPGTVVIGLDRRSQP